MTFPFFGKKSTESGEAATSQKAERSLAEGMACLTNDAAAVQLRLRALSSKCAEAATNFQQALSMKEKKSEVPQSEIATTLLNLGVALELQGKSDESQKVFDRAIDILKADNTLTNHIASAIQKLCDSGKLIRLDGPLDLAEKWHRAATNLSTATLPPEHASCLQSKFDLAVTLDIQGNTEADALYDAVFSHQANYLPVSAFLLTLAGAYQQLQRTNESTRMYERALQVRSKAYQGDHPDLIPVLQNYAEFAAQLGDHTKEADLLQKALLIAESSKGAEDPLTAGVMIKTAIALMRAEKFSESIPLFEQALKIREPILGGKSLQYARELRCLAGSYAMSEQFEQAEASFARALEILEASDSVEPAEIVDVATNLAAMYCERDELTKAEQLVTRMFQFSTEKLGAEAAPTQTLGMILTEIVAAKSAAT